MVAGSRAGMDAVRTRGDGPIPECIRIGPGGHRTRRERLSDAALMVGTNFTPRLFLSCGVGIVGGAANVLRLRYQIARNWILRTESARELGADLLYSVER